MAATAKAPKAVERLAVLLIEDSRVDAELCVLELSSAGFDVNADVVQTRAQVQAAVQAKSYDVILADYRLPGWVGTDALEVLKSLSPDIPFILVTGAIGEDAAAESLKIGATDLVMKHRLGRLPHVVRRALAERRLREQNKQAEAALRESEERYRMLFERNLAGVFVSSDNRLLAANDALRAMLGYDSLDEMYALEMQQLYCDLNQREAGLQALSQHGQVLNFEVDVRRKDGRVVTGLANLALLKQDRAQAPTYIGTVLDITETRALQKQLIQAQKMEAVGRLAGGIAHDFNNLLMIIGSYAQLIPQQIEDRAKIEKAANQIREATSRATAVVRQLLAISRRQVQHPVVLDLNALLLGLGKMLPRLIGEDIELSVQPLAKGRVRADAAQLEQVIMNLAVNARDAMPRGGKLTIETNDVALGQDRLRSYGVAGQAGEYVVLAVTDTGVGMGSSTQAHIFEPFFTTKPPDKGTGLGLSTVYGIVVQQSGGFIRVQSEVGRGSSFRVYLPKTAEPEKPIVPAQAVPAVRGSETILLVEDEEALREVTRQYLASLGYTVLDAANGEQALSISRTHEGVIHLLVTDMVMPGIGGLELGSIVQKERPQIPVIYGSGYTDRTFALGSLGPGSTFLQKPFSLAALATEIRNLLEHRAEAMPSGKSECVTARKEHPVCI